MKNRKGFTLVELLVVVAIIAVLAIAFMPNVFKKYSTAKEKNFLTNAIEIVKDAEEDSIEKQLIGVSKTIYSSENNDLKDVPDGYEYYISLDNNRKVSKMIISDKVYIISYNINEDDFSDLSSNDLIAYDNETYTELVNNIKNILTIKNDLYIKIKELSSNDIINFSINSKTSNTNGVYKTTETDSGKEVYYYRGNVNNNVIFNNMCWKIIRTTETGGVKMIYNGIPTNGQCNATSDSAQIGTSAFNINSDDNTYVGYMYGTAGSTTYDATHANITDSTIKGVIDTWYATNFNDSSVLSKIEDTIYCNDRSMVMCDSNLNIGWNSCTLLGYSKNRTIYGASNRSSANTKNPSPSLKCLNENDRFSVDSSLGNGALTYPVGLLTLDEAVFAGFNTYASNSSNNDDYNYLYIGKGYWTMTPIGYYQGGLNFVGTINSSKIGDIYVDNNNPVRPVISLANINIKLSGTGKTDDPYIVE